VAVWLCVQSNESEKMCVSEFNTVVFHLFCFVAPKYFGMNLKRTKMKHEAARTL
jgi:hypothetical protein